MDSGRPMKYGVKDFSPRLYQQTILATAAQKNTLIVLPTGLGKTNIFVMLAIQRLNSYPKSKVLLLGPTRPLIDQYKTVFEKFTDIPKEDMVVFTGMVKPETRHQQWQTAKLIFSTPQGLENDLIGGKISLADVSLLGFDEAHRAVGDYSYVWIAKHYEKTAKFERIVALTASPGSDADTINEVCKNLFIEDVEARNDSDTDVASYVKDVKLTWVDVELSAELKRIKTVISLLYKHSADKLRNSGAIHKSKLLVSRMDLIELQRQLQARAGKGDKDPLIWQSISAVAECMKIQHALELLETQGIAQLKQYLEKLNDEASRTKVKAVKSIVANEDFRTALALTRIFHEKGIEHPKMQKLVDIVKSRLTKPDNKIMLFTQYRDSCVDITERLRKSGFKAKLFVGQMKKGETGLSQKDQKAVLDEFREGSFQILVSTSVGEEGLDIPSVDAVIFYEPVPSAIRTVQRRGRTGRQTDGEVIILYTKGTRDENYRWTAHHKEKKMNSSLKTIKQSLVSKEGRSGNASLSEFSGDNITIHIDHREKGSQVIKKLIDMGAKVELRSLEIADYVLSDDVAIEFKTVNDFVSSMLDGRLIIQLQNMKRSYSKPLVMIEGTDDIYAARNVHPNAIRGMIASILVGFNIPLLQTRDANESAAFIYAIAKREQEDGKKEITLHPEKKAMSIREHQEYLVSALPGVGTTIARPLLKRFGSVENVMTASEDELREVELIGKKKAEEIRKLLSWEYKEL